MIWPTELSDKRQHHRVHAIHIIPTARGTYTLIDETYSIRITITNPLQGLWCVVYLPSHNYFLYALFDQPTHCYVQIQFDLPSVANLNEE